MLQAAAVAASASRWNCRPHATGPTRKAWLAQRSLRTRLTDPGGRSRTSKLCHCSDRVVSGRSPSSGSPAAASVRRSVRRGRSRRRRVRGRCGPRRPGRAAGHPGRSPAAGPPVQAVADQRPDVGEPGRRLVGRAGAAAEHDDPVVTLGRTRHLATGLRPDRHQLGPGGPRSAHRPARSRHRPRARRPGCAFPDSLTEPPYVAASAEPVRAARATIVGMVSRRHFLYVSAGAAVGALAGCADDPAPGTSTPAPSSSAPSSPAASPSSAGPSPTPEGQRLDPDRAAEAAAGRHDRRQPRRAVGDRVPGLRRRPDQRAQHGPDPQGHPAGQGDHAGRGPRCGRPTGIGEGGLLGIALAPGDEETLFAYMSTRDDNRVVRISLAGGKVGRPVPVLTGIPNSVRHHGGRLLFDPDGLLYVVDRRRGAVRPGPGPELAGRQDPADPARRPAGTGQPVRQPDLELRPSQHRGTGPGRAEPAVGHGVRRAGRPTSST